MKPVHLEIVQGTPFRFLVRVKYRNEDGELVPLPLPGCSARMQARSKVNSDTVLLDLSSDDDEITINEDEGTFEVRMSSVQTSALVWGTPHIKTSAVFQCEIEPPDGETMRPFSGIITLNPEVVR